MCQTLYDMLTQSEIHKQNDDREALEVHSVVSNVDVVNKHEHVVKHEDTLCEDILYVV